MVLNNFTRDELVSTLSWLFDNHVPGRAEQFRDMLNQGKTRPIGGLGGDAHYEHFGIEGFIVRDSLSTLLYELKEFSTSPYFPVGYSARKLIPLVLLLKAPEMRWQLEIQMYANYQFAKSFLATSSGIDAVTIRHLTWLLKYAEYHSPHPYSLSREQLCKIDAAVELENEISRQIILAGCLEKIQAGGANLKCDLELWLRDRNYPPQNIGQVSTEIVAQLR